MKIPRLAARNDNRVVVQNDSQPEGFTCSTQLQLTAGSVVQ